MHMFDWIFFAIMIPIPALLAFDLYVNRRAPDSRKSNLG